MRKSILLLTLGMILLGNIAVSAGGPIYPPPDEPPDRIIIIDTL